MATCPCGQPVWKDGVCQSCYVVIQANRPNSVDKKHTGEVCVFCRQALCDAGGRCDNGSCENSA